MNWWIVFVGTTIFFWGAMLYTALLRVGDQLERVANNVHALHEDNIAHRTPQLTSPPHGEDQPPMGDFTF